MIKIMMKTIKRMRMKGSQGNERESVLQSKDMEGRGTRERGEQVEEI